LSGKEFSEAISASTPCEVFSRLPISNFGPLEKYNISPPLPTLAKLAKFFGIGLGSLFDETEESQRYEVIRKDERKMVSEGVSMSGTVYSHCYELFATRMRNKKMTPILKRMPAGPGDFISLNREGALFLYVLEGELNMLIDRQKVVLEEGDSIYFDTSLDRKLLPGTGQESVILEVTAGC